MKTLEKTKLTIILSEDASQEKIKEVLFSGYNVKLRSLAGDQLITLDDFIKSLTEDLFPNRSTHGQCRCCGRLLTKDESVLAGIGEICQRKQA